MDFAWSKTPRATRATRNDALFTLILIYNREARYDAALRVISELQQRFPATVSCRSRLEAPHCERDARPMPTRAQRGISWSLP